MVDRQTKTIQWTINLPMDFPSDWDNDMIEFYLNESSWCCSNLISELEKYDEKNGCICGICEAKVAEKIGGVKCKSIIDKQSHFFWYGSVVV